MLCQHREATLALSEACRPPLRDELLHDVCDWCRSVPGARAGARVRVGVRMGMTHDDGARALARLYVRKLLWVRSNVCVSVCAHACAMVG